MRLSFSPVSLNNVRKSTLASPLGRGARQRVRGIAVNGEHKPKNRRVVSTSLCGDTYVLSMVADADILALSWQSGDDISGAPDSFKNKPKASDDAESLLALNPTLVVFGPGEGAAAKPLLDKRGIKYVSLAWGEDFESVETNRKTLSLLTHGTDKSKCWAETSTATAQFSKTIIPPQGGISCNLDQYPRKIPAFAGMMPRGDVSTPKPVQILYLSASGGTAGPGTYVDAAIRAVGGSNIITTQGWHTPSLESLVSLAPDLIVTSFFKDGYASVNEAGLRNKVLTDKLKSIPRVNVPGKLWPCAGPGLYEASDIIKRAIEGLE